MSIQHPLMRLKQKLKDHKATILLKHRKETELENEHTPLIKRERPQPPKQEIH